jgi:hypothetical protein
MPELPEGMMQRDKPVDDVFKLDEQLYLTFRTSRADYLRVSFHRG